MCYILTAAPPIPIPPRCPLYHSFPQYQLLFRFSSNKQTNQNNRNKKSRPGISTKHSITNYNKTGHKPSYQGWTGWSSRRKRLQGQAKASEISTHPTLLGVPQEYQAIQSQLTCRESSSDPHRIYHCHFSLYKLQWSLLCWFCGSSSHGLLDPSGS